MPHNQVFFKYSPVFAVIASFSSDQLRNKVKRD